MAEYHVGCGIAAIYAGTLNKRGDMWVHKSNVTDEAVMAVMQHMYFELPEGEKKFAYAIKANDGKYLRLMLEVSDECPEWAKDVLDGKDSDHHDTV